jgi:hypothetical protein
MSKLYQYLGPNRAFAFINGTMTASGRPREAARDRLMIRLQEGSPQHKGGRL